MSPRWLILAAIGILALGLGIERLIVTDEEAIEALLEDAASAWRASDFEGLGECLSEDFRAGTRDRREALAYARTLHRRFAHAQVEAEALSVEVEGDTARLRAAVWGRLGGRRSGQRVAIDLVRTPEGWRFRSAVPWLGSGWPSRDDAEEGPGR